MVWVTGRSIRRNDDVRTGGSERLRKRNRLQKRFVIPSIVLAFALVAIVAGLLSLKAFALKRDIEYASDLVPQLKERLIQKDQAGIESTYQSILAHTAAAERTVDDPIWSLATAVPWIGANFGAASEIARSANDVAELGLGPLVGVYSSVNWESVLPGRPDADLTPIQNAAPKLAAASHAVSSTSDRLGTIRASDLLPMLAEPLRSAQGQLASAADTLETVSDTAQILPAMMGVDDARHYLLMVQNSAETRASGGIPGALAILSFEDGHISLDQQTSAASLGAMSPTVPTDPQQEAIYSTRLGKYMQDVNLTPDFPSAATTAQKIWELKRDTKVDGVISIDPVVLSYILQSTGPVTIRSQELSTAKDSGLPSELTSSNVVQTLLSDVYSKIEVPELQDAYFAVVAKEVFTALSKGQGDAKGLIAGITKGAEEGRVLAWSSNPSEEALIAKYSIGGSVSGPNIRPAQFGVYFNDGTGAKMDYYVKRSVRLIRECPKDGYEQVVVRVTSTNTASKATAASLPGYVTGDGVFGVPPGSVQTVVAAYGPALSHVESAEADGEKTPFAPYLHADRPVGVLAQRLAPGESKTIDFKFGKIVQHAEPNLFVTPSVQPVNEVVLPTQGVPCG
ncbi:DUF4012 domain-containing protein [Pseudarthrobacter equi]|uniref:DUF4012 domain-containing protein n=1 Tax=Pseudarthrobacter equi TaxID=728066 RepID=UPI0021BE6225|nr:DUF4012 domain-containing protein [Pseudarthrobacter equi]MCT9625598.1 DUF4012 domain-containing protein [Pseudarthrobacter equi]